MEILNFKNDKKETCCNCIKWTKKEFWYREPGVM
jgi:hypothetical protein